MALPMLVGGADCGPSNPLQGLSKRFDSDRGLQQVDISDPIPSLIVLIPISRTFSAQAEQDHLKRFASKIPKVEAPLISLLRPFALSPRVPYSTIRMQLNSLPNLHRLSSPAAMPMTWEPFEVHYQLLKCNSSTRVLSPTGPQIS